MMMVLARLDTVLFLIGGRHLQIVGNSKNFAQLNQNLLLGVSQLHLLLGIPLHGVR
jgi:hypothetical protein